MEENQQYLGQESVGKLMAKYALPCIVSLLVGALYNIVDQIFIAHRRLPADRNRPRCRRDDWRRLLRVRKPQSRQK